jgi:succinoglycan biosynthesis transport protein ExoP
MNGSFDIFEYLGYLRTRWMFIASCCAIAGVLAASISLLLPKQYTATASVLIDAPAGNDPRAATAVSPVYLESLKTYEHFANSDTLFLRAIDRFQLQVQTRPTPADSLKRRVLKVTKPRDTKLLDINVTLPDPKKAQAVVQFIAEETVNLNRSLSRQSDEEFTAQARKQTEAARARLQQAEKDVVEQAGQHPMESLRSELDGLLDLKQRLQRELVTTSVDVADYAAQQRAAPATDPQRVRDMAGVAGRVEALRREVESINRDITGKESALAEWRGRLDRLEADRRTARAAYDTAAMRANETELSAGARGERLKIIDPGIVPQHPSSPNLVLNVMAALLAAVAVAILYVSVAFGSQLRRRAVYERPVYR